MFTNPPKTRLYYGLSFIVGMVLAILFVILTFVDKANQTGYIAAACVCALAGIVGGIIYLVKK